MTHHQHERGEDVSPVSVQQFLRGVDYPARKEALVACARENNAPEAVVRIIEGLRRDEFGGPQDVMKAYGEVRGS